MMNKLDVLFTTAAAFALHNLQTKISQAALPASMALYLFAAAGDAFILSSVSELL